ncbi:MAG: hypothetical protein H6641_12400 [Caldilineaceae bacterium]|nr:hypothetical protein [Caldilineaceae bacterium]
MDDKTSFSDFKKAFGEEFSEAINPDNWTLGEDLAETYERIEREVAKALEDENRYRKQVRETVFAKIRESSDLTNAGVYKVQPAHLEKVQKGLLFNGGVEACDGINAVHDTLPLTITQIGVCLVSYNGQQGAWAHRLFRKDLREELSNPIDEAIEILERRAKREGVQQDGNRLSQLARRGIMAYAERAILSKKSSAPWRMGHGSPAPYELLTGLWSSQGERLQVSLDLIQWFVDHKRFVFVPSAPGKRHLLTIGNALNPLEYVVLHSMQPDIDDMIIKGGYRDGSGALPRMKQFANEVAPNIAMGLFRVWEGAPPYIFYSHVDCTEMAAHIAIADSLLQEHRGFPMLIDLADTVCKTTFGVDSFLTSVQQAYTESGQPFRYLSERETRY